MTTTVNTDAPAYMVDGVLTDGEPWVALSSTVLTGDANSVTLTSSTGANDWSQYMDLVLIQSSRNDYADVGNSAGYFILGQYNDDAGTNYPWQRFYGGGSGNGVGQFVSSSTGAVLGLSGSSGANGFGGSTCRITDINSGKWKVSTHHSANEMTGGSYHSVYQTTSIWQNTAAIIKIKLIADTAGTYNFSADSRFDLFGTLPRMVS